MQHKTRTPINWEKAIQSFSQHRDSEFHEIALSFHTTLKSCKSIIDTRNINAAKKKKQITKRNIWLKLSNLHSIWQGKEFHHKDTMAMITLHSFFYFATKMKKVSGTDLLHLLTENIKNTHMMNSKMNCWTSWRKMCSVRKCQNNRTPILCFDSWEIHRHIK